MAYISQTVEALPANPLDLLEGIVSSKEWDFDRRTPEEMAVQVPGCWCDYSLFFSWSTEICAMHFSCAFDMRVPESHRSRINDLLATINEKMWLGHFGMWEDEGLPLYRHTIPLRGTSGASVEQMEDLVEIAIEECDRFYPTFQFVIWGGKDPAEAVALAMLDTVGEA
ncbi:MAG: YbjN domain-containing protein [Rhodospirillales bacterium]|nr:YbjN domain-containing protein [Rhodospirillales bacterium]MCW8861755.1 YbjN domain-containing protein [Rhodospirillales bacterium]MCW8951400.1 YbjN domain-containing protein [Rhodospirillales bacterium]MCW8969935.1 YbjN domain-containing protein [Rhodospirillales bacterium]MCW9003207.1 YbjN domain-containing protein [Rhodospirillales bacterium]